MFNNIDDQKNQNKESFESKDVSLADKAWVGDFDSLSDSEKVLILNTEKILKLEKKIESQQNILANFFNQNSLLKSQSDQLLNSLKAEREQTFAHLEKVFENKNSDDNWKASIDELKELVKHETESYVKDNYPSLINNNKEIIKVMFDDLYRNEINLIERKIEDIQLNEYDGEIKDKLLIIQSDLQNLVLDNSETQKKILIQDDKLNSFSSELHDQRKMNEDLKSEFDSYINNYKSAFESFNSLEDLQLYIQDESSKIAQQEISNYMDIYNSFEEDRQSSIIEQFEEDSKTRNEEILKIYNSHIEINRKLDDLQKLLDEQNLQINNLSEDKKELLHKIQEFIDNNKFDNNETYSKDYIYELDVDKLLNKEEIELLVKKNAIELVKEEIKNLNLDANKIYQMIVNSVEKNYSFNPEDYVQKTNTINHIDLEENNSSIEKLNSKIEELEQDLKKQFDENLKLRNDLFDEIAKNSNDNKKTNLNLANDDIIISNNDVNDFFEIDDEMSDDMKHNYYGNVNYIPGTKITRIKNYKFNENDSHSNLASEVIHDEAKKILEQEMDNLHLDVLKQDKFSRDENNQRLQELENLIAKQEAEIFKLKQQKELDHSTRDEVVEEYTKEELEALIKNEALKIVQSQLQEKEAPKRVGPDESFFYNIDQSMKKTLEKLEQFSKIQEKALSDLEETNKKIELLEDEIKKSHMDTLQKRSEISDDDARKELERLIEEKYKAKESQDDELKRLEEERKKINDTLELERLRLLSEIEVNKSKLKEKPVEPIVAPVEPQVVQPKEEPKVQVILEAPKRKRKQQFFYEIKVHSTPKLTKADLEK